MYFHYSLYKGDEYCSKMATATLLCDYTFKNCALHFRIKRNGKNTTKTPPKNKTIRIISKDTLKADISCAQHMAAAKTFSLTPLK